MDAARADLWLLDAAAVDAALAAEWLSAMGPGERHRYHGFKRPARRAQFLAGRMLLRRALMEAAGIAPHALEVCERPGAAPELRVAHGARAPYFSLSHSGHWIACAVSAATPLGVDIEIMDAARDIAALSAQAFTEAEAAAIAALPEPGRVPAFYALWSRREAEYKLGSAPSHFHAVSHPELSVALCTALPLQSSMLHTHRVRAQDW
ncbi:4'-phosphopantetheinyl transferase family protein [Pseudoduganella namucuonensis]|uniref:4'-phosphopantetheinyl transferase n=1 Tax=Pseudoduganella namucuonensis TaxID=1035707 RepID=A0A1I7IXY3_9BURK|nr:4'-phosphopantetheinyl transferase superfamily protein [Pseudoduganella namucuonensis]SFU77681.1 4'-phosphopantetheinyl transferase [Pseudoduganella namucuonensis]